MTTSIIISFCILLLLAYVFDISSSKTKIPSVILLLLIGWAVRQATNFFELNIPDLSPTLPILGTLGLILIVLEGSMELKINPSKFSFISKTAMMAFFPIILFSVGLAFAFHYFGHIPFKIALANAIPFAVISSAIAIPSAQNLLSKDREFVTYESSLSDIFGVILFNFIALNDQINAKSYLSFSIELIVILIITFITTLGLAFLLSKINHHVKFIPIILIIVLIYAITKIYHLPGLVFILIFGLFLNNLNELRKYKFVQKLQPDILIKEVHRFKELIGEFAFLVRTSFFLLFGYLIQTSELLNQDSFIWAVGICLAIFILRFIFLKLCKQDAIPLLFIAPRGLITILLYLSIPLNQAIPLVNNSLTIQVIILCVIVMMVGLVFYKPSKVS